MSLTIYQEDGLANPRSAGLDAILTKGVAGPKVVSGTRLAVLEVPQPTEPSTPVVPDAPMSPADPDPGTPADPAEPATVPAPQEPATPVVPEPAQPDPASARG
jgi:hypothetical protein